MASGSDGMPRRRGGRLQRRAALTVPEVAPTPHMMFDNNLAARLVSDWARGNMSATQVQQLAALALLDIESTLRQIPGIVGASPPSSVASLANLGSRGRYPNNCHRDLVAFLGHPGSPQLVVYPIPVKLQKVVLGSPAIINCPQYLFFATRRAQLPVH